MCESNSEAQLAQLHAATMAVGALPPENSRSAVLAHEAIARRAYEIYVRNGRPTGRCLQHWKQAEQELRDEESVDFDEQDTVFEESPIPRHEDYRKREVRYSGAWGRRRSDHIVAARAQSAHQTPSTGVPN